MPRLAPLLKLFAVVATVGLSLQLTAHAEVYKCTLDNGKVLYQNEPCASGVQKPMDTDAKARSQAVEQQRKKQEDTIAKKGGNRGVTNSLGAASTSQAAAARSFSTFAEKIEYIQSVPGLADKISAAQIKLFNGKPSDDWWVASQWLDVSGPGDKAVLRTTVRPNSGAGPRTAYMAITVNTKGDVLSAAWEK